MRMCVCVSLLCAIPTLLFSSPVVFFPIRFSLLSFPLFCCCVRASCVGRCSGFKLPFFFSFLFSLFGNMQYFLNDCFCFSVYLIIPLLLLSCSFSFYPNVFRSFLGCVVRSCVCIVLCLCHLCVARPLPSFHFTKAKLKFLTHQKKCRTTLILMVMRT